MYLTSYFVNGYNEIGPKPQQNNYRVCSNLPRGHATIQSKVTSAKLVLSGAEHYKSGNKRFTVSPGQYLLSAPEETLDLTITAPTQGNCFYFDQHYLRRLLSQCLSKDIEGCDNAPETLDTIRLPVQNSQFGRALLAIANNKAAADIDQLTVLLAENICQLLNAQNRLNNKRRGTRQELLSRLETAKGFITETEDIHLSLSEVEKVSNLSRFHLIRLFSQVYGMPPKRFHQNLILEKACEMIKAGDAQKEVAEALGFSTVSSFSRAYRRHHKAPPSLKR